MILGADGKPPVNDGNLPPPMVGEDGFIHVPAEVWGVIQDRLRKSDLFVMALATLARKNPDCTIMIDRASMDKTWKEGYGIDFSPVGQKMHFIAKKPVKLNPN